MIFNNWNRNQNRKSFRFQPLLIDLLFCQPYLHSKNRHFATLSNHGTKLRKKFKVPQFRLCVDCESQLVGTSYFINTDIIRLGQHDGDWFRYDFHAHASGASFFILRLINISCPNNITLWRKSLITCARINYSLTIFSTMP